MVAVTTNGGGGDASATAEKGGVLRTAITDFGFTNGFDPTGEYVAVAIGLFGAIDRTLVGTKHIADAPGNELVPRPGRRPTPEISSDGLKYTFKLKPGVKWAPPLDRDVTSADVAYAFQRMNAAPLVAQYGFYYFGIIKGMDGKAKSAETKISGIETPDDQTIIFNLEKPTGDFLYRLNMPAAAPIPEEVGKCFKKAGDYGRYVMSNGSYMIQGSDQLDISSCESMKPISGFDPSKSITLVRNPNYDQATDDTRTNYVDGIIVSVNTNVDDIFSQVAGRAARLLDRRPAAQAGAAAVPDRPGQEALPAQQLRRPDLVHHHELGRAAVRRPPRPQGRQLGDGQGGHPAGLGRHHLRRHRHPQHPADRARRQARPADYNPYPSEGNRGDEAKAKEEMKQSKYDTNKDGVCDGANCSNLVMINRNTPTF